MVSPAEPDGQANQVRIFSKKHAAEACPNDHQIADGEDELENFPISRASFSLQGMRYNQSLAILRDSDPVLYKQMREQLTDELAEIDCKIRDCTDKQGMQSLKIRHWVVMGGLVHNLSRTILEQIAAKHMRIGSVPSGYFYPELYYTGDN